MRHQLGCIFLVLVASANATTALFGPFQLQVPAHGAQEHCFALQAGEAIRYRYRASAKLDFNIHYHRGKDVLYPVRERGSRRAEGEYTAPHDDTFCLMWEHAGDVGARIDGSVERITR